MTILFSTKKQKKNELKYWFTEKKKSKFYNTYWKYIKNNLKDIKTEGDISKLNEFKENKEEFYRVVKEIMDSYDPEEKGLTQLRANAF